MHVGRLFHPVAMNVIYKVLFGFKVTVTQRLVLLDNYGPLEAIPNLLTVIGLFTLLGPEIV